MTSENLNPAANDEATNIPNDQSGFIQQLLQERVEEILRELSEEIKKQEKSLDELNRRYWPLADSIKKQGEDANATDKQQRDNLAANMGVVENTIKELKSGMDTVLDMKNLAKRGVRAFTGMIRQGAAKPDEPSKDQGTEE